MRYLKIMGLSLLFIGILFSSSFAVNFFRSIDCDTNRFKSVNDLIPCMKTLIEETSSQNDKIKDLEILIAELKRDNRYLESRLDLIDIKLAGSLKKVK